MQFSRYVKVMRKNDFLSIGHNEIFGVKTVLFLRGTVNTRYPFYLFAWQVSASGLQLIIPSL